MLESLTDAIEAGVLAYLGRIDAMGGMERAIEDGFPQREIRESAYRAQQEIDRGERVVVGVNRFQESDEEPPAAMPIDPAVEAERAHMLAALRSRRDAGAAGAARQRLEEAARGSGNLVPLVIDCVEKEVTLGEIAGSLARVFGEHEEAVID